MGLILPRIPPPTPVFYSAVTPPFGDKYEQKTSPSPPPNTPFPGMNLKVGKTNYSLDNLDPNWAKYLKSGQSFSRCGQKNYSSRSDDKSKRSATSGNSMEDGFRERV